MADSVTSLHLDTRLSHQRSDQMDPSPPSSHRSRPTNMQSHGIKGSRGATKDSQEVKGSRGATKDSQEVKGSRGATKDSQDSSGHVKTMAEVTTAHKSKLPTASGSRLNGDSSIPVSRSTRPSPQVIVLHMGSDQTGSHDPKHTGSHDPKHTGSHDPKHTESHDPKHTGSHDPKHTGSHDPKVNHSSSSHGSKTNHSSSQRPKLNSQSGYSDDDDIDTPHSKGLVRYAEDLNDVQAVTFVTTGRSGFTQDTPDFLSIEHGEESTVRSGEEDIAPAALIKKPDKSYAKEKKEKNKKQSSEKPSSKARSPTKERGDTEAESSSNFKGAEVVSYPKGAEVISPSDLPSPTSPGSPLLRSHSSPPEVKFRKQHNTKGQSPSAVDPPSHLLTTPNFDNNDPHKDTPHSDSSPEQKSKSIFKRFSDSFMRVRSKSSHKSLETTSWYFADSSGDPNPGDPSFGLPATVSEQRLNTLTEKERLAVVEDMEVMPRAQSLQHLVGPAGTANEGAVFGGEKEGGHAQISLTQVKVSPPPGTSPQHEDDDELKSASAPALLRFANNRKVVRRQSNSQIFPNDPLSPTDPHVGEDLAKPLEHPATPMVHPATPTEYTTTPMVHQATPMEHLEGSVEDKGSSGSGDACKPAATAEQKPRKRSFLPSFLHKTKKSASNAPSVYTIEENAAHSTHTNAPSAHTTHTTAKQSPVGTKKSVSTAAAAKSSPVGIKKSVSTAAAAKSSPVGTKKSVSTAAAAKSSPVGTKKSTSTAAAAKSSPVAARNSPKNTTSSPVAARNSPVAARNSPVAARNSPVAAKSSPVGTKGSLLSPVAGKKSPASPVGTRNSPMAAKKSPVGAKSSLGSPIAAGSSLGSPVSAKKSPVGGRESLAPLAAVSKRLSASTQPASSPAQSPTSKRASAPNMAPKKLSSSPKKPSSSSSVTPHSSKQNSDPTSSPVSLDSVFSSPSQHRKRKVGVPGPTSPLSPSPAPSKAATPLNITITQYATNFTFLDGSHGNQPVDLDALLSESDNKLSMYLGGAGGVGDGATGDIATNLSLSHSGSPLPPVMADQSSAASSTHSRQSSGEALMDIDDVPSPTRGGASQTPDHHAKSILVHGKGGALVGGASVDGAHPKAHFDFTAAVGPTKAEKQSTFTAALPPRPPSKRWTSAETSSKSTADGARLAQSDGLVSKKAEVKSPLKSTLRQSTKGRSSVVARSSMKKKLSARDLGNSQPIPKSSISRVKSPDLPITKDGAKAPNESTPKHSIDPVVVKHAVGGAGTLKRSSDTSTLKRGSTAMRSVRSSMCARPSSATAAGRKGTGAKDSTLSPSHLTMKRVSSGDRVVHRDPMRLSKSHSSMRTLPNKTGTLPRTQQVGGGASSQGDTLHRTPLHKTSASRKSMRKASDDIAVFNQISAEASVLKNSDHRRLVRPAFRQKPSAGHLKMLHNRQNVSADFSAPEAPAESPHTAVLDPNLYSTYMSKKKMDPAAINGLAIKLDFSNVKLRKTGTVDKTSEQAAGEASGEPEVSTQIMGEEMNTKHSVMLLMVKGRRYVQTYLVEPSATSLNSGDVFLCVSGKSLYHWVGKAANVIEKARGADIVSRILNRKELNCQSNRISTIEEGVDVPDRDKDFWALLGGKQEVKSSESTQADEVYEKGVIAATRVYELKEDGNDVQFIPYQANSQQMLKFAMLDTTKIFLLDFVSEVYVWVGRQSPTKQRKKALELGRAHFDKDCRPAVFQHIPTRTSVARASGRLRKNSIGRQSKHNINASMRKTSKPISRPSWALFARVIEGGESILLREKFSDWPEQGRIIKMKGHEASVKLMVPTALAQLKPADVDKMLKPMAPFEGFRLEGDNIHRGKGNYMVSRSSFACNRVRTLSITKWVVREYENVLVPEDRHGLFFSAEGYVIRWAYRITVVKELEGLTPGAGQFAQDKKYQKSLQPQPSKPGDGAKGKPDDGSDSEPEGNNNEECKKLLESGGRDRCAYFFWQGNDCTVNEKGAAALMTIELDKEKGPQIRVVQGKEPAAFLTLFRGKMTVLRGRSDNNSLQTPTTSGGNVKMYCVRGQEKDEAFLLELDASSQPLATQLRSRGCYIIQYVKPATLTLWVGSKSTAALRKVAQKAIRCLKERLKTGDIVTVQEGQEPGDFWASIGDRNSYVTLLHDPQTYDFTPRLYELTSTTGDFTAAEVLYPARNNCTDAFPFLQDDIYSAVQPAMFLLDSFAEIYVWIGWWPVIENKLLKDANATTGSAYSRWLQDKRLALETALLYSKACGRPKLPPVYLVHAGTEHQSFVNHFPFWVVNTKVQELNCKDRKPLPQRVEAEEELKKYSRTKFTLDELKKRPLPEGVDPAKLEVYLCDEEFDKMFKMSREEFSQQPIWKKTALKKQAGLF